MSSKISPAEGRGAETLHELTHPRFLDNPLRMLPSAAERHTYHTSIPRGLILGWVLGSSLETETGRAILHAQWRDAGIAIVCTLASFQFFWNWLVAVTPHA